MASLSAPQVLSYENPPLLLADKAQIVHEDGTAYSSEYGLHTFLELTGAAYPQDFYQTDAWGGFDPKNDQGRSYQEMLESYRESCEREIRNLIGHAVPKNFSWAALGWQWLFSKLFPGRMSTQVVPSVGTTLRFSVRSRFTAIPSETGDMSSTFTDSSNLGSRRRGGIPQPRV
jgi:hypothetical protein